jgi:hypothetical protein
MADKPLCKIDGCGKPVKSNRLGLCNAHGIRLARYGDPLAGASFRERGRLCAVDGCGKSHHSGGYCKAHFLRWKRNGDPLGGRVTHPVSRLDWLEQHRAFEGDECLIWPYSRNHNGYGSVTMPDGTEKMANRYMCEIAHGAPPTPKHQSAHSCGTGHLGCVNPRHLRWATVYENMADMVEHGTVPLGERNGHAKLTEEDVREIKRLRGKVTQRELAERFGITHSNVAQIHRGYSWKHVEV